MCFKHLVVIGPVEASTNSPWFDSGRGSDAMLGLSTTRFDWEIFAMFHHHYTVFFFFFFFINVFLEPNHATSEVGFSFQRCGI